MARTDMVVASSRIRLARNLNGYPFPSRLKSDKQAKEIIRAVSSAISKLKDYGYIDDGEFVRSYVEAKGGTRGKLRIKRDLALLGADERTVEEAVCSLGDQREAAARAAEKYLRSRPYDYRKLCAHLSSKGFEWEDIRAAVRGLGKETEDEGSV